MKYTILAIFLLVANVSNAQFSIHAYGGPNLTDISVRKTEQKNISYQTNAGWQVGTGVEFQTSPYIGLFVHLGTSFVHRSFFKDSIVTDDSTISYSIRPNFIGIPFGAGYKFPLKNNRLVLKVYAGLNIQLGISGQEYKYKYYYFDPNIDPNATDELQKDLIGVRNLKFGDKSKKEFSFDYASTNWQFLVGTGLMLDNKYELMLTYNKGLTNILPGRRVTPEIQHFNLINLNFKYNFPTSIWDPKKK